MIKFTDSAFRHGYTENDYWQVRRNRRLLLRSRRGLKDVHEVLGRNDAGDYLLILMKRYLKNGEEIVIVFHIGRMSDGDRRRFIRTVQR